MTNGTIFVIADDLTGASDAALQFHANSRGVRVCFAVDHPWDFTLGSDIVQAFDSETRNAASAAAAKIMRVACDLLYTQVGSGCRVYKKVDSTLRGPVGIEIQTALAALGKRWAILAPSFPETGRTVLNGCVLIKGVPISQTVFRRDPLAPVVTDRIAEIIRQTSDLPVYEVGLSTLRKGADAVWQSLPRNGEGIIVIDAETQADLDCVADLVASRPDVLPCGSAGLAQSLARAWFPPAPVSTNTFTEMRIPETRSKGRVMVLIGSAHPQAYRQLNCLKDELPITHMVIDRDGTLEEYSEKLREWASLRDCDNDQIMAVSVSQDDHEAPLKPWLIENYLAEMAREWFGIVSLEQAAQIGIFVTGGATATAVCRGLGIQALWPMGELAPGVSYNMAHVNGRQLTVITKAGGFGDETVLLESVRFLTGGNTHAVNRKGRLL